MSTNTGSLDADERKAQATDADMALIFPKPTELPKRKAGRPRKIEVTIDDDDSDSTETQTSSDVETATAVPDVAYTEKMIWKEAMFVAMTNFQVRSADGIAKCVPIADEFLNIYNERWEK